MKTYNKPDLNAPRFRPEKLGILNRHFCAELRKTHPELKDLTDAQIKKVITTYNGAIWDHAVNNRDGIELDEQLGFIFIGSCPRKKSNVDFEKSAEHGMVLQHRNWDSDDFLAKIFYTNYETKYRFEFHEMWGFEAHRDFRRTVPLVYPKQWNIYVRVDNMLRASRLFRKQSVRHKMKNITQKALEDYDPFDMS